MSVQAPRSDGAVEEQAIAAAEITAEPKTANRKMDVLMVGHAWLWG